MNALLKIYHYKKKKDISLQVNFKKFVPIQSLFIAESILTEHSSINTFLYSIRMSMNIANVHSQ